MKLFKCTSCGLDKSPDKQYKLFDLCIECTLLYPSLIKSKAKQDPLRRRVDQSILYYQLKNSITVKCLSDRILLYMRYAMDQIIPNNNDIREFCYTLYNEVVRGNFSYTNRDPRVVGGAIVNRALQVFCENERRYHIRTGNSCHKGPITPNRYIIVEKPLRFVSMYDIAGFLAIGMPALKQVSNILKDDYTIID